MGDCCYLRSHDEWAKGVEMAQPQQMVVLNVDIITIIPR
jgi:hypothetical protein